MSDFPPRIGCSASSFVRRNRASGGRFRVPRTSFRRLATAFRKAAKPFRKGAKPFRKGAKSFRKGAKSFRKGAKSFRKGAKSFRKGAKSFRKGAKSFRKGAKSFRKGAKSFRKGAKSFRKGAKSFRKGAKSFRKGAKSFRKGAKPFRKGAKSFRKGAKLFRKDAKSFRKAAKPLRRDAKPLRKGAGRCLIAFFPSRMMGIFHPLAVPSILQAIERLYDLNVGTTPVNEGAPHERPHKPLLLMAVFDLLDAGLAAPDRIPWSRELKERFAERFRIVRKHNDRCNPDLPFRYLAGDGFWQAFEVDGVTPIRREILASDLDRVFARFSDGFDVLVTLPENRRRMREALVARYFPQHAAQLLRSSDTPVAADPPSSLQEEAPEYGRSTAFRRKILEIYDHQCAACGLRIRLPEAYDVSFIDAAHLIPFADSHNDHPTNGLALCKNHHWAMDRNLIAPCPDRHWRVSRVLDERRSNGERELIGLAGKPLLLPREEAFYPAEEFLRWRCEQLSA